MPPAGLRWTLAVPGDGDPHDHDVLAVRHVRHLPASLLVRPDGYLAGHSVPTTAADVLDRLPDYLPTR